MHAVIRRYQLADPDATDEVKRYVNEGFVPLVRDIRGFLAFYWLDAGEGTVASVSVFEDRAASEESDRMAAKYIKQHGALASLLPDLPETTEGTVGIHELRSGEPDHEGPVVLE
jgi:heme-degrading monooxygenase HmoA